MSEPSIRKIKIPLTPSGQKLPKKVKKRDSEPSTNSSSILHDLARFMQKKYKILASWKGEPLELLELCKTRSESKCLLELFTQSKKAVKKASKPVTNEPTTKTSKSTKTTVKKPLFTTKKVKRHSGSNETRKAVEREKEKKDDENTITEIAQRSK
jgi:hypothetical protein